MPEDKVLIAKERQALMKLMDEEPYKVPNRKVDENILIATWNIQAFGEKKPQRSIQYIADMCERFDIVAIQEVKTNLLGLSRLQELLPGNYKILVTDPTGNNERFAFLYDKRTVVSTGLVCEIGLPVPAKTHIGYQLHRMPYCASFRAGRFDFVIVNVHIYCGNTEEERQQREKEIETLVTYIDKQAKLQRQKVFDRDFFVLGDFNIEGMGDCFFEALKGKGFVMPERMNTLGTNFAMEKTYDKIAWVPRPSFYFDDKCNVIPFGQVLYQDLEPENRKKLMSDHLPLWAEFRVNKLTQELDQIVKSG